MCTQKFIISTIGLHFDRCHTCTDWFNYEGIFFVLMSRMKKKQVEDKTSMNFLHIWCRTGEDRPEHYGLHVKEDKKSKFHTSSHRAQKNMLINDDRAHAWPLHDDDDYAGIIEKILTKRIAFTLNRSNPTECLCVRHWRYTIPTPYCLVSLRYSIDGPRD
jgi:hypothetical protein